jgi:hypothetical protein
MTRSKTKSLDFPTTRQMRNYKKNRKLPLNGRSYKTRECVKKGHKRVDLGHKRVKSDNKPKKRSSHKHKKNHFNPFKKSSKITRRFCGFPHRNFPIYSVHASSGSLIGVVHFVPYTPCIITGQLSPLPSSIILIINHS